MNLYKEKNIINNKVKTYSPPIDANEEILKTVASLNENMNLANVIKSKLENKGINSEIINLVELNLPMYDSNKDQKDGIHKVVLDLAQQMQNSQF